MSGPVTIVGSYLSPYVRKVLVCLHLKGVDYVIDPIVPFYGNDDFSRISPVRRIPVLLDGDLALCDSTVVCEYLDERYPGAPLLPKGAADRARARWLEEYADTRMGEVFIWRLFNERVIRRFVWGEETDSEALRRTLEQDVPQVLDHLEGELPAEGWLFGAIGIADVAVAAFFRNAAFAGFTVDEARWPVAAGFVTRALDHPAFRAAAQFRGALDARAHPEAPRGPWPKRALRSPQRASARRRRAGAC